MRSRDRLLRPVSASPRSYRTPGGSLRPAQHGDEPTFGLASDVAANIFVVLFMAVLIGLVARPAATEPTDYDLKGALRLTERRPNAPVDLVNALHRRQSGRGTSIDLLADRLRLSSAAVERSWRWTEIEPMRRALQSLGSGAVDLFVFDPRGYAIARDTLAGSTITEISVPIALRNCARPSDCRGGMDWSEGFRTIIGLDMTDTAFRAALAELLAARPQAAPPARVTLPTTAPAATAVPVSATRPGSPLPGQAYGLLVILALVLLLEALIRRARGRGET